jgi:hypothetical protein
MPGPLAGRLVDAAQENEISTAKRNFKPKRALAANRRGGKCSAIIFSTAAIRPQLVATFDAPVDPKFVDNRQVLQSSYRRDEVWFTVPRKGGSCRAATTRPRRAGGWKFFP